VAIAAGFATVAISSLAIEARAMIVLGFGIHMLHNTLQTKATQMAPEARGLAVPIFANVLFMGQAAGVRLSGLVIGRIRYSPVFLAAGAALLVMGGTFALLLDSRPAAAERGRNQRTPPRNLSIPEPFRLRFARHRVLAGEVDCGIRQPGERDDGS
jgi:predicted MFS family arabinose efflux permease